MKLIRKFLMVLVKYHILHDLREVTDHGAIVREYYKDHKKDIRIMKCQTCGHRKYFLLKDWNKK